MKRIIALILCFAMLFCFAGCGEDKKKDDKKNDGGRILYNNVDFKKYIELGDYKNITVDTASEDYKKVYDSLLESDVKNNDFYVKKTEGTIAKGDNVNMDYSGKKDGVAFEGGTAKDQFLVIGSGKFIPGFEEGLIGAQIGSTVDLNLTFPKDYKTADLAGAAVVFTVKINYVKTDDPLPVDEYYKKLGFSSADAYYADAKKSAIKDCILNTVLSSVKVNDYPKADLDKLVELNIKQYDYMYQMQYGMDLKSVLSASGQTMDVFKKNLSESYVKPMMKEQMAYYNILDNENLKVTSADVDKRIEEMIEEYKNAGTNVTREQVVTLLGEYYFEALVISEKVADYLSTKATIK